MKTLSKPIYFEMEVKKSRFLTWVEPVDTVAEAKERIANIRAEFPDARHVCFAFYTQGNTGMSDDGEPSGTAAKPMFNVLNHKDLQNVVAVVVRYFGGIKLGAGGLSRAYGGAVSQALEGVEFKVLEKQVNLQLGFPFALESQIRRVCEQFKKALEDVQYQHNVSAILPLSASEVTVVQAALLAVAPGNSDLVVQVVDEETQQ
jgi:uncharacterized YigZ family protein